MHDRLQRTDPRGVGEPAVIVGRGVDVFGAFSLGRRRRSTPRSIEHSALQRRTRRRRRCVIVGTSHGGRRGDESRLCPYSQQIAGRDRAALGIGAISVVGDRSRGGRTTRPIVGRRATRGGQLGGVALGGPVFGGADDVFGRGDRVVGAL